MKSLMMKKQIKNAHMGQHLLVEVYNVPFDKLNDPQKIEETMVRAVETEGLTVLNTFTHQFEPYGVTTLISLAESHLSCHTWPEKGCVACLLYTSPSPRDLSTSRMPSSA